MINILEYAHLASHVYQYNSTNIAGLDINVIKTADFKNGNFSPIPGVNFYRLPDVHYELSYHGLADDLKEAFGYGFHAELYVKFEQGQAVDSAVAFRGFAIQ